MSRVLSARETERYLREYVAASLKQREPDLSWAPADALLSRQNILASTEVIKRIFFDQIEKSVEKMPLDFEMKEMARAKMEKTIMDAFGQILQKFGHTLPPET